MEVIETVTEQEPYGWDEERDSLQQLPPSPPQIPGITGEVYTITNRRTERRLATIREYVQEIDSLKRSYQCNNSSSANNDNSAATATATEHLIARYSQVRTAVHELKEPELAGLRAELATAIMDALELYKACHRSCSLSTTTVSSKGVTALSIAKSLLTILSCCCLTKDDGAEARAVSEVLFVLLATSQMTAAQPTEICHLAEALMALLRAAAQSMEPSESAKHIATMITLCVVVLMSRGPVPFSSLAPSLFAISKKHHIPKKFFCIIHISLSLSFKNLSKML